MIQDAAFIIVPTLTLWNIIPLFYYNLYNQIIRFYCSLLEPITPEQITVPDIRRRLTRSVHFTICWAGLQVLVALMHICVICHTGMSTNEMTRCIVNEVLRVVPEVNVDLDRFLVILNFLFCTQNVNSIYVGNDCMACFSSRTNDLLHVSIRDCHLCVFVVEVEGESGYDAYNSLIYHS
ncbi:hypothetical protein KIN20_025065 [Parelaphostrongylus tenuis]|uniref:Uncharacterized protein n=1 Tax=Parelaphostrongylus tenuis TaxID=148309 RepID=A0AAD5NAG9_PARTN|nr:hypothetical protein KIN20_025065 [Parelaphostrongylus tenuis]